MKKISGLFAIIALLIAGCGSESVVMPNDVGCGQGEGCLSSTASYGYQVGNIMPDTTFTDLEGNETTLYEMMEGKSKVIISLEASWCSDCHRQDAKHQEYVDAGVPEDILLIPVYTSYSKEENTEKIANLDTTKAYLQETGYTYESYFDTDNKLWDAFNAAGTPTNIVLDSNARIKAITLEYDFDTLLLENKETLN